jgi:hypothetical protein
MPEMEPGELSPRKTRKTRNAKPMTFHDDSDEDFEGVLNEDEATEKILNGHWTDLAEVKSTDVGNAKLQPGSETQGKKKRGRPRSKKTSKLNQIKKPGRPKGAKKKEAKIKKRIEGKPKKTSDSSGKEDILDVCRICGKELTYEVSFSHLEEVHQIHDR